VSPRLFVPTATAHRSLPIIVLAIFFQVIHAAELRGKVVSVVGGEALARVEVAVLAGVGDSANASKEVILKATTTAGLVFEF
jgi:hypothetical protein